MDELFSIESADAGYGRGAVLTGLDLSVRRGEFVSLIGPNGAGKSTLLRLMCGLLTPSRGRVLFKGKDMDRMGSRERGRGFSVVMRIDGNIPAFPVRSFLEFGLFPHVGSAWDSAAGYGRIMEIAERTGITPLMERPLTELSTGEFQLVQVARALIQNSSVVILDEPVSNLDYMHGLTVMGILKDLNSSGTTILCALHDVNCASDCSTRIICLKSGRIVADGNPENVVKEGNLAAVYDCSFLCMKNPVTGKPMVIPVPGGKD